MIAGVLLASLAGSLHCGAMCGGFVLLYGGARGRHAAYHAGRLLAYVALGAVAGFLAGRVDAAADALMGIRRVAGPLLGLVLFIAAVRAWRGPRPTTSLSATPSIAGASCPSGLLRSYAARPGVAPAFSVGLLAGLLPCGWLWGYVLLAGATSDPANGALVMAAFWVGTVPALLAVGGLTSWLRARIRACRLVAAGLFAAGLLAVFGQWGPLAGSEAPPASGCEHPR